MFSSFYLWIIITYQHCSVEEWCTGFKPKFIVLKKVIVETRCFFQQTTLTWPCTVMCNSCRHALIYVPTPGSLVAKHDLTKVYHFDVSLSFSCYIWIVNIREWCNVSVHLCFIWKKCEFNSCNVRLSRCCIWKVGHRNVCNVGLSLCYICKVGPRNLCNVGLSLSYIWKVGQRNLCNLGLSLCYIWKVGLGHFCNVGLSLCYIWKVCHRNLCNVSLSLCLIWKVVIRDLSIVSLSLFCTWVVRFIASLYIIRELTRCRLLLEINLQINVA